MNKAPVTNVPISCINSAPLPGAVNPVFNQCTCGAPNHNQASCMSTSFGDEGTNGGMGSGTIKGPAFYITAKPNLIANGAPTPRSLVDTLSQNTCNSIGTVPAPPQTVVAAP
ncbi:PAAR-like domain-containing protein [Chromobacterium haemolyticum]|uniref:PAAR-like domain-containing protein n=1 Tax=Chromobacterium haemolyticum TaxID=394935 RepID=UPI003B75B639